MYYSKTRTYQLLVFLDHFHESVSCLQLSCILLFFPIDCKKTNKNVQSFLKLIKICHLPYITTKKPYIYIQIHNCAIYFRQIIRVKYTADAKSKFNIHIVTVGHILSLKFAISWWDLIPRPLALQAIILPTELKETSTYSVSREVYEPTTVPTTLGRGVYPLQYVRLLSPSFPILKRELNFLFQRNSKDGIFSTI